MMILSMSYDNSKKIFKINPKIYDQLIYTLKINT